MASGRLVTMSALEPGRLQAAQRRHPASVGASASWRLHYEQDDSGALRLALAGAVESFDAADLTTALVASLDIGPTDDGSIELTLRDTDYLHHTIPFAIAGLAGHGPGLRVTEVPPMVARLLRCLPTPAGFTH